MFRDLRADEIEVRVAQVSERDGKATGVSLLLYKDARCDQNILDETVGPMNWQRYHARENANCIVSIWDKEKQQWVGKEDTGTESNTEKEKGLASDSFKRACFNWGIGRELYTAPFIFVKAEDCTALKKNERGKWQCFDRFYVSRFAVENKRVIGLAVKNSKTNKLVFAMSGHPKDKPEEENPEFRSVEVLCADCGKPVPAISKGGVVQKTAAEVIAWSRETFMGETLCWSCAKKRLDKREEQA